MVRSGEYKDIPDIVRMSDEFWQHTIFDDPCCPDTVSDMARHCIDQGLMSVLEVDDCVVGFICGVQGVLLGNSKIPVGTELAWWVDEAHRGGKNGITLLRHIEGLAKEAGIKYWSMCYMESSMPKEIEGIYQKMGYKKSEALYTRKL